MPTVRYTGYGRYRVDGVTFEHGDEHTIAPGLASYLTETRDNFEYVDDGDVDDDDERVPTYEAEDYDPDEHTVDELRGHVAESQNIEWLKLVRSAEADGKNRTTALEAIDNRLDELQED